MIRNLFNYPGSKRTSLQYILPLIPHNHTYVEPFCGTGVVCINRLRSDAEVLNDLNQGIIHLMQVIQNQDNMPRFLEWIDWAIDSKEDFNHYRDTWNQCLDPVEKALRYFYICKYGFTGDTRYWGRHKKGNRSITPLVNNSPVIKAYHIRLQGVQLTSVDWSTCMKRHDSKDTVFYLDPPYLGMRDDKYTTGLSDVEGHRKILDQIFQTKGFVAISGYPNDLYDQYPWDSKQSWVVDSGIGTRSIYQGKGREALWVKQA